MKEVASDLSPRPEGRVASARLRYWLAREQEEREERLLSGELKRCDDDRCTRVEIHEWHEITDDDTTRKIRKKALGWEDNPFEPELWVQRRVVFGKKGKNLPVVLGNEDPPENAKGYIRVINVAPWQQVDRIALDEAIVESVSSTKAKIFTEVARDVRNLYGDVPDRTIWRRISTLCELKRVEYVKFVDPTNTYQHKSILEQEKNALTLRRKALRSLMRKIDSDSLCRFDEEMHPLDALGILLAAEAMVQDQADKHDAKVAWRRTYGLGGYVKPGSRLLKDPEAMLEQLRDTNSGNAL